MRVKQQNIQTPSRSYRIEWHDSLAELIEFISSDLLASDDFFLVDASVFRLYRPYMEKLVNRKRLIIIPAGESSKSLPFYTKVVRKIISAGITRKSRLWAIGGGVTGDLAGFAASTLLRGIDFFQIPTTLLSMVDSSVGGKTGVNLPEGKNLIGTFHQPAGVFIATDFLYTLPGNQFRAGVAEVLKSALIESKPFFSYLKNNAEKVRQMEREVLLELSIQSIKVKAKVVEQDEREGGKRAVLNFGHTLAHALESVGHYRGITHGEAVAVGMHFAAKLSQEMGYLKNTVVDEIIEVQHRLGLPLWIHEFPRLRKATAQKLIALMRRDKKNISEKIRFVLLKGIGKSLLPENIDDAILQKSLESFIGGGAG